MNILDLIYISYDGNNINDGTNYVAYGVPIGTAVLAPASAIITERADNFPVDGGARLRGREWVVNIRILATGSLNNLTAWFDTSLTTTPKKLLVKDAANKQWYVYCRPIRFELGQSPKTDEEGRIARVTLYTADPIWKSNTENSNTWNITATGQTNVITVGGNKYARPLFEVTPTSARSGGYGYRRYIAIANRTNRIYTDAINLPDSNWDTTAITKDASNYVLINQVGGIDNSVTTIPYDGEVGTLPPSGTGMVDNEQISWTGDNGTQLTGVTRGINGTTAATHANNAVIYVSKAQADGDDVRVINDTSGIEEYRWFGGGGMNSATTRVFSNVTLPPKIQMTIESAIASSGAVSSIQLANTTANRTALKLLRQQPYPYIAIDMGTGSMEIFKYTRSSINLTTLTIGGTTRAQKGTSEQAHSAGATARHIYGYYIMYGNSSVEAPTTDDTFKPIINLASSTNTSHVYADFYDVNNPSRTCQWKPEVILNVGRKSLIYTATQETFADVASVMGAMVKVFTSGGVVRSPDAELIWSLYHPAGITTLTWSGSKYRATGAWPAITAMEYSNDGAQWTILADEASPSAANTWEALSSHSSVSLGGTYLNIRQHIDGTITARANNKAGLEVSDLTATLSSSNVPLIYFGSEEVNNWNDFRITNNTSGQWLEVSCTIPLNQTIYIDTENLEAYTSQGVPVQVRLDDETRAEWLPLGLNGDDRDEGTDFTGTATLRYNESGAAGVTVVTKHRDRNL